MIFVILYLASLVAAATHVLVRRDRRSTAGIEVFLLYQLAGFGLGCLLGFIGHGLRPVPTALGIGWPPHPQFQLELGLFELGVAVASWVGLLVRNRHYWLGAVLPSAVMMPGAGVLHVHELLVAGNFAPYNTVTIGANFLVPLTQLALVAAVFRRARRSPGRDVAGTSASGLAGAA